MLTLASASGNVFAYAWKDEVPASFDGGRWARILCPRGEGLGLDGLFLAHRPTSGEPWILEHWDADGAYSFCGNGTRAALALSGAPEAVCVETVSSGERVLLRRDEHGVGLRMPAGPDFGLKPSPLRRPEPQTCAWIGNPQLVLEVPDVEAVDFARFAPPLRHDPAFPEGTNVSIVSLDGPGEARIRSWERGVEGETLCCGTGCAAAGAWLAQRTGLPRWRLQPAGRDAVQVEADVAEDGLWSELWLSGPVRLLGTFAPGPALALS